MQFMFKVHGKMWFSGFLKANNFVDASVSAFTCISLQFSSSSLSLSSFFGHFINSSVTWMPTHTQANINGSAQEIAFIQSRRDPDLYRCLFLKIAMLFVWFYCALLFSEHLYENARSDNRTINKLKCAKYFAFRL